MIVFNEKPQKAHLLRSFHSLMVFERAFFKCGKIVVKQTPP